MTKFQILLLFLLTPIILRIAAAEDRDTSQPLLIGGAVSLRAPLQRLGKLYAEKSPFPAPQWHFASSQKLRFQWEQGAPMDLFISADEQEGQKLLLAGYVQQEDIHHLGKNYMQFVMNKSAMTGPVTSFAQWWQTKDRGRLVMGNPLNAPIGRYGQNVVKSLGLEEEIKEGTLYGENAQQVLQYLLRQEAQGGIIYASDGQQNLHSLEIIETFSWQQSGAIRSSMIKNPRSNKHAQVDYFIQLALSSQGQSLLHSGEEASSAKILSGVKISLQVAIFSTILVALVGTLLGALLARKNFFGKELLDTIITLPMVLPPTVVGYYLVFLLGRKGPIGGLLDQWFGIEILFTWQAGVLAAFVVSLPLMVKCARSAIESVDENLISVAYSLGRMPFETFLTVILPLAKKGLVTGLVLTFTRSLGEFGATLMVSGNIPGVTSTLPLALYTLVENGEWEKAHWVAGAYMILTAALLFMVNKQGRSKER